MHDYAGDPENFPENVFLPDDGDEASAKHIIGPVLEVLADRTAWTLQRLDNLKRVRTQLFTASGTFVPPPGATVLLLQGYGGGGGGGCGPQKSINITTIGSAGGGGGAGATQTLQPVEVTPGAVYTVTIGAGGAGGRRLSPSVPGQSGGDGGAGGDTTFADSLGNVLAAFPGSGGGKGGKSQSPIGSGFGIIAGGLPSKNAFRPDANYYAEESLIFGAGAQVGGEGVDAQQGAGRPGGSSPENFVGGAGGSSSAAGGGGGGGAGPAGDGAAGADGGGLSAPLDAASAAANSGAGGGGGGGTINGGDSFGGDGGSGALLVAWIQPGD